MKPNWNAPYWLLIGLLALLLAGCSPAGESTQLPEPTPTAPLATPTPEIEARIIEVEWPADLRLGDSDIVRLALIPSKNGYTAQVEYSEHELKTEAADVPFYPGYKAEVIARLDAAGMALEPKGDQVQQLIQGQTLTWRWTIFPESAGQHRMSLFIALRWIPQENDLPASQTALWQSGLDVRVHAPLGTTAPKARALGIVGVIIGGILTLPLAEFAARQRLQRNRMSRLRRLRPNPNLTIESGSCVSLSELETSLLRANFANYSRVLVDTQFTSGYSGARTFLVQPIRTDGSADAYAIVKIGSRSQIQAEYANYETFVRHTLPPITGRVQDSPVVIPGQDQAALQYTFVGTPGTAPISLGAYARSNPAGETAQLIEKSLFSTFGPTWWMQRRPYLFSLVQEYDRLMPVHLLLELIERKPNVAALSGDSAQLDGLHKKDLLKIQGATVIETRPRRKTATLAWPDFPGGSQIRVRYRGVSLDTFTEGRIAHDIYGRIVATRADLLKMEAAKALPSINLEEPSIQLKQRRLPNPIFCLDRLLSCRISGTRSIIHGDLNLENILIGPGKLVWLIDFAATRKGHTLFDFARLEVELATQVIAEMFADQNLETSDFLAILERLEIDAPPPSGPLGEAQRLLGAVRRVAGRCLYDPADRREFRLALILAYLGTLKFANLDNLEFAPLPKSLAFAAASYLLQVDLKE